MAKSSFAKPGAKSAPAASKPTPAKAPQRPAPPSKAKPSTAKPAAPAKKTPATAAAPQRPAPPSRPAPSRPPGIRTNVVKEPPVEADLELLPPEGEETTEQTENTDRRVVLHEPDPESRSVVNMMSAPVGQPVGDFDANDFDMPQLKIAQGSDSPLINDHGFSDGDIVLNTEAILWQDGCDPVELTIARFQKQFMQQMDYGSDEMGKIYNTKEEAEAAGLIPFGGHEVGYVSFANALILIKKAEGIECSVFTEEFEDNLYALAMWKITGTAYKEAARKIMGQSRTRLKDGLHTGSFNLEAKKVKGKIGMFWVPQLTEGELHSQEFIEFITNVAGG